MHEEFKKIISEKLIAIAWHPNRCWNWCMSENEKEEIGSFFIKDL